MKWSITGNRNAPVWRANKDGQEFAISEWPKGYAVFRIVSDGGWRLIGPRYSILDDAKAYAERWADEHPRWLASTLKAVKIDAYSTVIRQNDLYYIDERKMIGPFSTKQDALNYRQRERSGSSRENPAPTMTSDLLLLAGGVAAVGLVGYLVWKSQQAAQVATQTEQTATAMPTE
jgi:hypothetical protein